MEMKAVIAAAGYGTRMLPLTKVLPKELLPVGNKPVIQYIVEGLADAGLSEILIITSQGKFAIEDYFDKNYELEEILKKKGKTALLDAINYPKSLASYCFVRQSEQLGFPHAVLSTQPWIDGDFFCLTVGDTVFHPKIFQELLAVHKKTNKGVVACKQVAHSEIFRYGVVETDSESKILTMLEKPDPSQTTSTTIQIGLYILPTSLFTTIQKMPFSNSQSEISLPDVMLEYMKNDELYAYVTDHGVRDTGNPTAWLNANNELQTPQR